MYRTYVAGGKKRKNSFLWAVCVFVVCVLAFGDAFLFAKGAELQGGDQNLENALDESASQFAPEEYLGHEEDEQEKQKQKEEEIGDAAEFEPEPEIFGQQEFEDQESVEIDQETPSGNVEQVVFSEIAWMGTEVSANNEWIELKNLSEEEIDLDGWLLKADDGTPNIILAGKIEAQGFFLLERTSDSSAEDARADQIYSGALGNSGEWLKLFDDKGRMVDEVDCHGGWFAGDNTTKQTMELGKNGLWQDSKLPGGTPRRENISSEDDESDGQGEGDEAEDGGEGGGFQPEENQEYRNIFINELLPDPKGADGEGEWIEIFNMEEKDVSLQGWRLRDASGKSFVLENESICAGCFKVLPYSQTKIVLNNTGDLVQFFDSQDSLVSEAVYGKVPSEDWSFARKADGEYDWTEVSTPGKENVFPEKKIYSKELFLNEIYPNPEGTDTGKEWIEIFNGANSAQDLSGWMIESDLASGGVRKFKIAKGMVPAKGYLVVEIKKDGLNKSFSIRNSREFLRLVDPNGQVVDGAGFWELAGSGLSYVKEPSGKWSWSRFPTPCEPNRVNNFPKISIKKPKQAFKGIYVEFDASKTKDKDGDKLKFSWEFGDGKKSYLAKTKHKYAKKGSYQVRLQVDDGSVKAVRTFELRVESFPKHKLEIVKIVPNPAGKDTGKEIVAIANLGKKKIDLENFFLATGAGEKKLSKYPIFGAYVIASGEFEEMTNEKICKFSLRNTGGVVALLYPDGKIADIVKYQKQKISDNEAYVKNGGQWEWIVGTDENIRKPLDGQRAEEVSLGAEVALGAETEYIEKGEFLLATVNHEEMICECASKMRIENWKNKNKIWLKILGVDA